MSDDIQTEARSLLDGLTSWGDGPNWSDPTGQCIPIPKVTLRRLLEHILGGADGDEDRRRMLRDLLRRSLEHMIRDVHEIACDGWEPDHESGCPLANKDPLILAIRAELGGLVDAGRASAAKDEP